MLIGIIGGGPRGVAAIEALIQLIAGTKEESSIKIILFEPHSEIGPGPNHSTTQLSANWINLSKRDLIIPPRKKIEGTAFTIDPFPGFQEWDDTAKASNALRDEYPPRKILGRYLKERANSLIDPLTQVKLLSVVHESVEHVEIRPNDITLTAGDTRVSVDELVLCMGHQAVENDQQIKDWRKHHEELLFDSPYPTREVIKHVTDSDIIGIRGYGLSMIDLVRAIANKYGAFVNNPANDSLKYQPEKDIKLQLVPFSIDGLPVFPKPLNAQIDRAYSLTNEVKAKFRRDVSEIIHGGKSNSARSIIELIAQIAILRHRQLTRDPDLHKVSVDSLFEFMFNSVPHPKFTNIQLPPDELLACGVKMASGTIAPTLDFTFGQVWRHLHPTMYRLFDHSCLNPADMKELIEYDEQMKQYTFGPPVDSMKQLLALSEYGMLNLNYVKDPGIDIVQEGWKINTPTGEIVANKMVDTVLAPPDISRAKSTLLKDICEIPGVSIFKNSGIKSSTDFLISGIESRIAVSGRLTKGSVLGTDSILECFNDQPVQWARGVRGRMKSGERGSV